MAGEGGGAVAIFQADQFDFAGGFGFGLFNAFATFFDILRFFEEWLI